MKKRVFVSVFFILTFLLSSTFIYAPDNRPPDQPKRFNLTSGQVRPPTQFERWRQPKEDRTRREQSDHGTRATTSNVELVGMWPYGGGWTCILDATRDIVLIANGHTLQVLDIFIPSSPSLMSELYIEGQLCGMTLSGDYVYVLTNYYLKIIDISDPYNPSLLGSSSVDTCGGYRLVVSGNYAYVAAHCSGLNIYDISDPSNITHTGHYHHDNLHVNDVALWGNYAVCDCQDWDGSNWYYYLEIIDVTNPSIPSLTGSYSVEANYWTGQVDVTSNGYAYLCINSNNNGKIVVIDVASDPGNPTEVGSYVDVSNNRYFSDVTVSGNYAYVYSNWGCDLIILDTSNPASPSKVGQNHTTDCCFQDLYVSGDYVGIYFCGNFSLYDVSDRTNPFFVADYDIPDSLGWSGNIIEVSGDYVYMSSNSDGLRVMDVSDLSNPIEAGTNDDVWGDRGLAVSGNYVYHVDCCNLYIFDISSPFDPTQVSHMNRPNQDGDWRDIIISGEYAYISGMEWDNDDSWVNLCVIDISDPADPTFVGYWVASTISGHHNGGMDVSGDYIYLAVDDYVSSSACLKILDISNPTNPAEVGSYTTTWGGCRDVVTRGDYAYLAGDKLGIFDVSDPSSPSEISTYDYWHNSLALSGDYIYLAQNSSELKVVDISDPNNPTEAGYYQSEAVGQAVDASGNYIFLGGSLYILRNTLAPEVSITKPSPFETIHGSVYIEAQASHSSGIEKVEIYIDDALKSVLFSSPFEYEWNTGSASEGIHKIRARAVNNDGKSSDAEIEVTVRNLWDLTISSPSGGTTNPTPGTHSYNYGSNVQVEAFPDTGYEFAGWTGDVPSGQEMDNPVTINMDGDKSITATFSVVTGNRELVVSSGPGGTTSPAPGSYSYPDGTQVWVSANPAPGSSFLHWTGSVPWGHQSDNPIGITMDSNKSLTANFTYSGDYYIESLISPQYLGGGIAQNVQADDDTVTYTLPFNFPYFRGTLPTGSNIYICTNGFIDFATNSTDNSPSDNELAANQRIAPCWTDLTTNGSAQSGEDIYITEEYEYLSIRWVAETQTQEPVNVQVILYRDGEIQFNYNGGNADFSSDPPTIGISKGDGTYYNLSTYNHDTSLTNVNSDLFTPAEIDNPPSVNINNISDGDEFSGTPNIGVSASDDNQVIGVEFYVDDDLLYTDRTSPYYYDWDTSTYSAGAHTIKVIAYDNIYQTAEDERSVTVRGCYLDIYANQGGTTDPAPGSYNYTCGTEVQIEAIPNNGYTFSSWGGDVPGGHENDNPLTLTVDWDGMWINAYFSVQPGNYELNIDARYGGTTDPTPGSYSYSPGSQVTVTAVPDTDLGASFWYWQGNVPSGQEYTNPLVLTMNDHKSIAAKFQFPKTWTFMVYLDGDNDLESAAIDDFLEMASVGSDENINIVVQFDRISGYDTRYGDWTSTKRFYITEGMTPESGNALQDLGELNHGESGTLVDFINWGRENYPANYFALVLWNHGGGWRESKEEKRRQIQELKEQLNFKDVCWDYTNGFDYLETDEVRHAFWATWYTHLIGFDACLMGMVEVAYQMSGYGSVMVASEEVEPGPGWPYNTILQDLADNPDWDESELATAIVDRYYESYGDDYTQSAIDLQNVNRMSWVIDSFAWSMINNWDSDQDSIKSEAQNVMTEIENIVIHERHGSSWADAHGLAIYFPVNSGDYNSDYPDVIWFPWDSSWKNFLDEFYDSMGGSWIEMRRICTQQFDVPEHIDLYHFCELINTESEDFYSPSLTTNDFIGGGTAQNIQEDDDYKTYPLPFDFPYFGEFIPAGTDIYISTNGYVDFDNPSSDYSNSIFELANNRRIAVCWTDLTTDGVAQAGEDIYISQNVAAAPKNISATRSPDDLVIRWVAETLFDEDPVNVELVLFNDGRIKFNYGGGNTDFSGQPPTIGVSKGDGVNLYISSYNGASSLTNAGSEVYASAVYILTISTSAGGTTDPSPGDHFYGPSESATITAIPDNYYDFAFWSEDASGSNNPLTIIVDQNMSVTANFRKINPPTGLSVQQEFNRSLLAGEYINVLTWAPNPANTNIAEYNVYFLLSGVPFQLGTVSADNRVYWHRGVDKTLSYTYFVSAVSDSGNEGEPITTTIQGEGESAETRTTKSSITRPLNEQSDMTTGKEGLIILKPIPKEKSEDIPEKISQPLNFAAHKVLDFSLPQERFTHVLVWQANPENKNIDKYRIYCVEGKERMLLAELESDTFDFRHEEVEPNKTYTYALVAVDKNKRECKPVYAEVK